MRFQAFIYYTKATIVSTCRQILPAANHTYLLLSDKRTAASLSLLLLLLSRLLLSLLANHLDLLNLTTHFFPLLIRLALAFQLTLSPPPSMPEPLLPRPEALRLQSRSLHQLTTRPVVLSVTVVLAQLEQTVWFAGLHSRDLEGDAGRREFGICFGFLDGVHGEVELAFAFGVHRVGKDVVLVEDDADVLAVGVSAGVAVVFDVAGRH